MRLRILSDSEIDALYGRPRFTQEERDEYFALAPTEKETLKQLRFVNARINFILQLGYFKARNMFFVFDAQEVEEDIRFIRDRYFPDLQSIDAAITKVTRLKQQKLILALCHYRNADAAIQKKLKERARQSAAVCGKPVYVFRELMDYLAAKRIVAPGYSTMQDMVGGALAHEQRRQQADSYTEVLYGK